MTKYQKYYDSITKNRKNDINPETYGLMDLSSQLHKGMTIVCRSYVIGHKFINPIYECGVK